MSGSSLSPSLSSASTPTVSLPLSVTTSTPTTSSSQTTLPSSTTSATTTRATSTTPLPNTTTSVPSLSTTSSSSSTSNGSTSATSSSSLQAVPSVATSLSTATMPDGGLTTVTSVYTTYGLPTASPGSATSGSSSSSNTAAIAGGTVGGVVGLALIALILWFCIRKRKRDDFDGDFDPDRVVAASPGRDPTLPRLDMDVTPYSYDPNDGAAVNDTNVRPVYDMAQRSDGSAGFLLAGAARSQTPPFSDYQGNLTSTTGSHYPPSSSGHGLLGAMAGDHRDAPSRSSPNAFGAMVSSKEREATMDKRRMYVANEGFRSGDVVQHQDGGRVQVDRAFEEPQREIPPSYDSIGPDQH